MGHPVPRAGTGGGQGSSPTRQGGALGETTGLASLQSGVGLEWAFAAGVSLLFVVALGLLMGLNQLMGRLFGASR